MRTFLKFLVVVLLLLFSPLLLAEETVEETVVRRRTPKPQKTEIPLEVPEEEPIDLTQMDSTAPQAESTQTSIGKRHGGVIDPHFSIFFDLLLVYQPGKAEFSFVNFHPLIMAEIIPTEELQFTFEVRPDPRYYELDYQITKQLQIRAGKIWIPIDDLGPHNIFGGQTNTSRLQLGTESFLPDIFSDLGVGLKYYLANHKSLKVESHLYVANGFRSGGTDPLQVSPAYPSFKDTSVGLTDNNNDKAIGGRLHALFDGTVGLGASVYSGTWTDTATPSSRLTVVGLDAQYRKQALELRAGLLKFFVGLPTATVFARLGTYGEMGYKFGKNQEWKFLARGGTLDLDDRTVDIHDQMILGGMLIYKPGLVQLSLEHNQDIKKVDGKTGYSFTGIRTAIQL